MLEAIWREGHWVDLAILITLAELLALVIWRQRQVSALGWPSYGWNLLSGLALMLALRVSVTDGHWAFQATCLAASGMVHALDLRRRLLGRPTRN